MNDLAVMGLEAAVVASGLAVLLLDLWVPPEQKRRLGYLAAAAVGLIFLGSFFFLGSFSITLPEARTAFGGMYVLDALALFFKRFFLVAALLVLLMSIEFADRFEAGIAEFYALVLFALAGMMFAASANDFCLLFVSLELITVTFYVLTSFERGRVRSLEAGVKYLVLGAVASAFLVYGIALVYGGAGTLSFSQLAATAATMAPSRRLLSLGLLLVFAGLGFKLAAVPFQVWAPDVYQGAPTPTTAFLAVGSKAAGFVLLLRVLHLAAPDITVHWTRLLAVVAALTILYGNLCAIPQRNLKRLLGYSSIAHAGYMLLGVTAWSAEGMAAILYYLSGYLFTMVAAFTVICLALRGVEDEDLGALAGLHRRSPLLGATLALAMVSLAGVPPLAGFFGKFLLLKSVVARAGAIPGSYALLGVALVGIVISFYYYFGVIRAIYWLPAGHDVSAIEVPRPMRWMLYACLAGMLWLGIFPSSIVNLAEHAVRATLKW
jgi:NADH-quinone oxidoreductase subunit N